MYGYKPMNLYIATMLLEVTTLQLKKGAAINTVLYVSVGIQSLITWNLRTAYLIIV